MAKNSQGNLISTWKLHGTKKKLPTNYKELPALILGIHQEIWEVPAPKKQYFTMPPYSTWNPCGMDLFHVESMESTWNMFHHINHVLTDMDSIWNPHGIHMKSMWIPRGMHLIFQLILKSDSKF